MNTSIELFNPLLYRKPVLHILYLILILAIVSGCNAGQETIKNNPNSKSFEKMKVSHEEIELEKIKSTGVKARNIYSKFSDKYIRGGGKEVLVEKTNFDEKGNRTEQFRYISSGDVDLQWLYDYDYYNKLIRSETFDGFRKRLYMQNLDYNSDGTLNETEEWTEKSQDYKTNRYFYDQSQNLIEVKHFDTKGRLKTSEKYIYNNDELDSLYYFNANNEVISIIHPEYDSLGRRTKEITIENTGKIRNTEIRYDSDDNIIAINNDILSSFKFTYDDNNNLVLEEEFNSQGFLQSKFEYEYESGSNLTTSKIRYDGENDKALIVRYEYEFY